VQRIASVRVRITLAAVLVVGIALAAGGAWVVGAQRHSLAQDVDTAARLRSRDIAATIADGDFPHVLAVPRGDENLVQVVDAQGRVVAASANLRGGSRVSTLDPGPSGYAARSEVQIAQGDGPFRVVARRVVTSKGAYTIYVAGTLERVDESTSSLIGLLALGLPALLVLVGVITWVVTGRALRPVEAMRREVEEIGAKDLHRRVPEPGTEDEIGRLARTMNAMLGRLEDATERQRRFVADASHELRSPLTGIRAQVEVDLAHPEHANWQATERDVLDDTVRLQRLVEDLLTLATADASALDASHRDSVDLDEIVLTEARRLRSRTPHRVDTSAVSGAQLVANSDQLVRAVRNLLDNAARHAASTVTVALHESECDAVLSVADDGPGIPPDQRERVFERFTRLDGARTRDGGGTGLGLAIAHEVVAFHGGTITIDGNGGGAGVRFTMSLPLTPAGRPGSPAADPGS
jgi:signal transduction histidine kinase